MGTFYASFKTSFHFFLFQGEKMVNNACNINIFNGNGKRKVLYESAALPLSYLGLL
jgi:hypothetical protein